MTQKDLRYDFMTSQPSRMKPLLPNSTASFLISNGGQMFAWWFVYQLSQNMSQDTARSLVTNYWDPFLWVFSKYIKDWFRY